MFGQVTVSLYSEADLREYQEADSNISHVIKLLKSGVDVPHNIKVVSPDIKLILKEKRFGMRNGLLWCSNVMAKQFLSLTFNQATLRFSNSSMMTWGTWDGSIPMI